MKNKVIKQNFYESNTKAKKLKLNRGVPLLGQALHAFIVILESSYLQFFGDDFLRLLLLRYVFCDVVLHLHRGFRSRQYRPRCQPPLPEAELLEHPSLQHLVLDLAAHLEVRTHFMDNHEIDWSRAFSSWRCAVFGGARGKWRRHRGYRLEPIRNAIDLVFRMLLVAAILVFLVRDVGFLWDAFDAGNFFWTLFTFRTGRLNDESILERGTFEMDRTKTLFKPVSYHVGKMFALFYESDVFLLRYFTIHLSKVSGKIKKYGAVIL